MFYILLGLLFLIGVILGGEKLKGTFSILNFKLLNPFFLLFLIIILGNSFIHGSFQILFVILFAIILFFLIHHLRSWFQKISKPQQTPTQFGSMTRKEALEILGLKEGVDRETIQKTHRELLKKNHPDRGGSNYLTALINEAKNILLPH